MARGPEGKFKTAVDKKLPASIYHQAMGSLFNNGTPDRYYEGPKSCVWVEYKWIPKARVLFVPLVLCTPLQRRWLERAALNGTPARIVVAGPGWVCWTGPNTWSAVHDSNYFKGNPAMIALMIEDLCRGHINT